jgi:hypothetical protein
MGIKMNEELKLVWFFGIPVCISHIFFVPTFGDLLIGTGDRKTGDWCFLSFKWRKSVCSVEKGALHSLQTNMNPHLRISE